MHRDQTRAIARPVLRKLLRPFLSAGLLLACAALLSARLEGLDLAALRRAFGGVTLDQWGLAALATGLSFLAVARYDVIAHRHFATHCPAPRAALAGASAIALGQPLGAGVVVGALVRWRMVPGLSLPLAARLSLFVALSFLAALLVTIALVRLAIPTAPLPAGVAVLILVAALALVGTAFFAPTLWIGRHRLTLPSLPALWALWLFCCLDTGLAAFALHCLLPAQVALSFAAFFPAFLLALGAAILSGTPGGVGPFELALLALLPATPEADLIAAILAFRILYYACPALIAAALLFRRPDAAPAAPHTGPRPTPSARAELGVLRQNGGAMVEVGRGTCGLVASGQTLVALFDPCHAHIGQLAAPLQRKARAQNRIACAYKITARHAAHARRAGWAVLHVADEAVIDTARHDLQGPTHRQLRRKLRHAEAAGLVIVQGGPLPIRAMTAVAAAWDATHGPARGFSMGRFDPTYLRHQIVFLAWQGKTLLGFISLHRAGHEWCLDLMRARPDAPDGTMHALVHAAILAARAADVPCLSLAAVPAKAPFARPIETRLRRLVDRASGGTGLRQFKTCFAPRWQPLYMAAPTRAHLALAACDLARTIRAAPTPGAPPLHNQHEEKPIAPVGVS